MGRILFKKKLTRTHRLRALGLHVEGALLRLFWILVRRMRPDYACTTGRWLLGWLGPKTHKHAQLIHNLRLAFPHLPAARVDMLARGIWGNLGVVLAEAPHLHKLTIDGPAPTVYVTVHDAARPTVEERRPAIYVSAHLGNWEAVAFTIAKLGIPLSIVYGPQGNPALETLIQAQRRVLGCRLVAKANAIRQLVHDVREGRSVGLLPDQREDTGEAVPFFGINAPTTTSPAWLALKLGCPLIPVQIERRRDSCFRAVFHQPIRIDDNAGDKENITRITADLNQLFEQWIRERPEQWLCIKRRWPVVAYATSLNTNRA